MIHWRVNKEKITYDLDTNKTIQEAYIIVLDIFFLFKYLLHWVSRTTYISNSYPYIGFQFWPNWRILFLYSKINKYEIWITFKKTILVKCHTTEFSIVELPIQVKRMSTKALLPSAYITCQ